MYSKILRACLSLTTWHVNGENFVNVADRLTRFTHHWLESLWLNSTSKEKNSQTSLFILSWAAFHKCRGLVASMSADCILLIIGMTFQYSRSTNSDPWSFFNLSDYSNLMVHLVTLPRPSPGWQPKSEGSAGIPHHFFHHFPAQQMSWEHRQKTQTTIPQCLSPSSPWAYFLTIKPRVCFQNLNLMRFAHPSWPYNKPFTRKFLSVVFLSQSRSTSANIKAHKSEIRHKKMKMVPKRLERFPEMTIAIILVSDMKLLLMWSQLPCRLTRRLYHSQRPTPNTSCTPPQAAPQWRHTRFVRSCPPFYLLMACSSVTALFLVQITSPSPSLNCRLFSILQTITSYKPYFTA